MHLKFAEILAIAVHENMHESWRLNNKKLKGHIKRPLIWRILTFYIYLFSGFKIIRLFV